MAAKIKTAFDVTVELIPGGRGVFDVKVDGFLIYSKSMTGTFPQEDDLVEELRSKYFNK